MERRAAVIVAGSLIAAAGAPSAAEAQVTGTLQASVTVVDDPVRNSLIRSLRMALEAGVTAAPMPGVEGVAVRFHLLPAPDGRRRVRIEILY